MDSTNTHYSIAIDGTAASGKSTAAQLLAQDLGCSYLDTGKLYRAIALDLLKRFDKEPECWAEKLDALQKHLSQVSLSMTTPASGECRILLQGEDVSDLLSDLTVEQATPYAARLATVRDYLLDAQRDLAERSSVVMAGRDIGTVVLPNATLKVFIEADLKERARRRLLQHKADFSELELQEAASALRSRDDKDANREFAPMACAVDAIRLDSSQRNPSELVAEIRAALESRLQAKEIR